MSNSARRHRFSFIACCALVAAPAIVSPSIARAGEPSAESPQIRYRQAIDAFKAHKYDDARHILLGLWDEKPTYDVAVTLVQTEYALQHFAAAANYLTFALANVPPTEKLGVTEQMKKDQQQLRELAARLDLTVSEPGAEIAIDGKIVGKSPLGEFYVEAGDHPVQARIGDRVAKKVLKAEKGKMFSIELVLPQPAATSAPPTGAAAGPVSGLGETGTPPPRSSDTAPPTSTSPGVLPAVIGGGVALAALATGIGFRVSANGSYSDAEALRAKNGAHGCTTGTASAADCAALDDANSSGDRKANISTGAFVVAGAALVGTAVYWFWPRHEEARSGARLNGLVSANGGYLGLTCDF